MPAIAFSTGKVTRCSTSSGVFPGAAVLTARGALRAGAVMGVLIRAALVGLYIWSIVTFQKWVARRDAAALNQGF